MMMMSKEFSEVYCSSCLWKGSIIDTLIIFNEWLNVTEYYCPSCSMDALKYCIKDYKDVNDG